MTPPRPISLANLKAVEIPADQELPKFRMPVQDHQAWRNGELREGQTFAALVQLAPGSTVPECMDVRSKAGETILTANIRAEDFRRIQDDPTVVQVVINQRLKLID